jgi:hypothetical protein
LVIEDFSCYNFNRSSFSNYGSYSGIHCGCSFSRNCCRGLVGSYGSYKGNIGLYGSCYGGYDGYSSFRGFSGVFDLYVGSLNWWL